MNILLVSSASISVHLSDKLHARYVEAGHVVTHLLTQNARLLWDKSEKPQTMRTWGGTLSDECDMYFHDNNGVGHIKMANWADICVICPADFNIIGKISNGIADDYVTSTLAAVFGRNIPIYIAESMNCMMYANPIHLSNVAKLNKLPNVCFIKPTVKKLACGDYGIGGLADIDVIFNITTGHIWRQPIRTEDLIGGRKYIGNDQYAITPPRCNFAEYLPTFDEPGAFGAKRKYDRHEGVDIYCKDGSDVFAVEDGVIVDSYQYTGEAANCAWWNDTWCIKIKGKSGVITYGELKMPSDEIKYMPVGTEVKAGDKIGIVGTVLKDGKLRTDIRNHNTAMLHVELRTESCHIDGWSINGDRDRRLLDPSPYLYAKNPV